MQKISLVLPYEFEIVFQSLPLEQAGRLILAIYAYEQRNILPDFSDNPKLEFAWETHIKPKIDENVERYNAICEARRNAGSKGGRTTQEKQKQANQANGYFANQNNQKEANQADCDGDGDGDGDYEINKKEEVEEEKTPQKYLPILEAWNNLPVTNIRIISGKRLQMLKARIKQYSFDDVLKAIQTIHKSPFLLGDNKRKWQITFDWFVLPNNFPKVLEGNYLPKESELITAENRFDKVIANNQNQQPGEDILFMDIVRAYKDAKANGETRTLQEYAEEYRQRKRGELNGIGTTKGVV